MNYIKLIKKGIVDENPIFVQLLALCPLLAVTTSAINAVTMGLSTTAVMICACMVISLLRKFFTSEIRIAAFVVIVASFVTVLQLLLEAYAPPSLSEALCIYIPLITVNCILFARIESFASKNRVFPSIVDALGMGLGFTAGLATIGIIREFLGTGSVFGVELLHHPSSHILIMIMAPGAFFTLGTVIMIRKYLLAKRGENKK
jgi:electron transport complex protein RnfE